MKAHLDIEFGKDTYESGWQDILWTDYDTPITGEYYDNPVIEALASIVDFPFISHYYDHDAAREQAAKEFFDRVLENCVLDEDGDNDPYVDATVYVNKKQDDYTGQFKYRKQGTTRAVPSYYVNVKIRFTVEQDVTSNIVKNFLPVA
jgi:hypothetical protein